eukprot:Gregarina_sp_Poly_1__6730@NODE_3620_length_974_cov_11_454245_g2306_i0_p4_GENE_NODE_3620_length_974_cov_11_454245_g2306_i0NODE_3620_length_974_cov_11_454245_g2306_i0_p4_ORF_typecomplete_len102_score9_48cEGF/PF12662_7/2e03cEGF/PF12662_7/0_77_NODE_3620_length_974_cov_11_454245_g2306_i0575880
MGGRQDWWTCNECMIVLSDFLFRPRAGVMRMLLGYRLAPVQLFAIPGFQLKMDRRRCEAHSAGQFRRIRSNRRQWSLEMASQLLSEMSMWVTLDKRRLDND